MIISPENPIANYASQQVSTTETLSVTLSNEQVRELDLADSQVVKGSVSDDGKSITLQTENGRVSLPGNFVQVSGNDVNVRVRAAETPDKPDQTGTRNLQGREPTRQSQLDRVFENAGAKIDKNSGEFENLLTNLKDAIFNGDGAIFGELNFEDLPTVEYSVSRGEIENDSWAWDAPESKETEQAKLGDTFIDFDSPEFGTEAEDEQTTFNALLGSDDDWEINLETEIGEQDHIWLQGRVKENHGNFEMWFENPGTAAYARQNMTEVVSKIESFGIVLDHLGISPFPKERADNPPKSTFMIEV